MHEQGVAKCAEIIVYAATAEKDSVFAHTVDVWAKFPIASASLLGRCSLDLLPRVTTLGQPTTSYDEASHCQCLRSSF